MTNSSGAARAAAALSYLGAALLSFIPPLAILVLSRRDSAFVREHAAQALNTAITTALYGICSAIVGGLLAVDSLRLGLRIAVTSAMFCWLVTLGYLTAAAVAAARGRHYQIPGCLCAELLSPRLVGQVADHGVG